MRTKQSNAIWSWGLWLAWACGLFLAYTWFEAELKGQQLMAAALFGLITAAAIMALRFITGARFAPRFSWFGSMLLKLPGKIVADLARLAWVLWEAVVRGKRARGAFQEIPFEPGRDDPESAARRGWITVGTSVAPNTYVVAVQREKGSLLVHQLVAEEEAKSPKNKEWPL